MFDKQWLWEDIDTNFINQLMQRHKISALLAELLYKRGISTEDIPAFLNPKMEHLQSPFDLKDMGKAVERIQNAILKKEKILIFGDYDVDGITSTAVLYLGLNKLEADVSYYIPNREEGYGLNTKALEDNISKGVSLIITVDCGISAVEELEFCNNMGVDCIITDHHLPPETLPSAYATINPKQRDCPYKFKELAGVGLAFKLVKALFISNEVTGWDEYLDIVALGTVADLVPLLGENRTIVTLGLDKMNQGLRLPLKMLGEVAGVKPPIDSYHLGFVFGPRLNAAGRLEKPKEAIELMLAKDEQKALELAVFLNEQNKERQEVEQQILEHCIKIVENMNLVKTKVLVLASENWHHGVIGIVASRLVEKYHRPVVMLAIKGTKATGSCRSIGGFHLYEALAYCEDLLVKYGGHSMAAGLTLEINKIDKFKEKLNDYALENNIDEYLPPKIYLDMSLDPKNLGLSLIKDINRLKPFGQGNPAPVFRVEDLEVARFNLVGKQKNHLKVDFKIGDMWLSSIGFKKADLVSRIYGKSKISFAGYLDENTYNGNTNLQLKILDLKDESAACIDSSFEAIDLRNKSLVEYLRIMPPTEQKYLIYTNDFHKNSLDGFYFSHSNVIIKGYDDDLQQGIPVFLNIPLTQGDFHKTLQSYKEIGISKIIFAFSKEKTILVPSRELLIELYQIIKRLNLNGEKSTASEIKSRMGNKFSVDYLVDRGLNIFNECNLLHCKEDCWLITNVEEKVDYKSTVAYQKYLKQHELFLKWHNYAIKTPLNDLMNNQQFIIEEEQIWI